MFGDIESSRYEEFFGARHKATKILTRVLEFASIIGMISLVVLVLCNALGRYLFSSPLPWTEEVAVNVLAWLGAVGIIMAAMRGALISCTIVIDRLAGTPRGESLRKISALFGSAVMAYGAWRTFEYLMIFGAVPSLMLRMPKAILIGAVLLSFIGLSIVLLLYCFRRGK